MKKVQTQTTVSAKLVLLFASAAFVFSFIACMALPHHAFAADDVVFTVYTQAYEGAEVKVAKEYTEQQLTTLADPTVDAIAGQYVKKGSMGVWASNSYVTFESLFSDAGVTWKEDCTAKWGGSAEKSSNVFTYAQLTNRKFLPNASIDKATGVFTFSEDDAVTVTPALALTAHRAFVSTADEDSTTAAQAKEAALKSTEEATKLVPIIGASAEEIESASPAGKPYWTDTDSITVVANSAFSVSYEPYAGDYYKVTYLSEVPSDSIVSMSGTAMSYDNGQFVALATEEEIAALTKTSFVVSAGTPVALVYDGDLNANSKTNIVDAQIAYDAAKGVYTDFTTLSQNAWLAGDVNGDGVLDANDAFAIQYKALYGEFEQA